MNFHELLIGVFQNKQVFGDPSTQTIFFQIIEAKKRKQTVMQQVTPSLSDAENTVLVDPSALPKKVQNEKRPAQGFRSLATVPCPTFLPDLRQGALEEGWGVGSQPPKALERLGWPGSEMHQSHRCSFLSRPPPPRWGCRAGRLGSGGSQEPVAPGGVGAV